MKFTSQTDSNVRVMYGFLELFHFDNALGNKYEYIDNEMDKVGQ
jgi:hypothetical protein